MHFAAHYNQPEICVYVMEKCKDVNFWKQMYWNDSPERSHQDSINTSLDRYLNTPDKMVRKVQSFVAILY